LNPTKNKHIVIEVLGLDKQASYLNGSKTATPYDGSGAVDLYSNAGKDDGADGADINWVVTFGTAGDPVLTNE